MKGYLSALSPAARLTVWKVLAISVLAAGAQVLLLHVGLRGWDFDSSGTPVLEAAVQMGKLSLAFGAGLLLVCAVLVLPGLERGAKTGYTIRRLAADERVVVLLWGGLNALLLLIFWGIQAAAALALSRYYFQTVMADTANQQSLFIAFSRSPYLHALLPLWDWPALVRNVLCCVTLGMSSASLSFHWRHGRKAWTLLPLAVLAAVLFPSGMDGGTVTGIGLIVLGAALVLMIFNVWRCHEDEE